MWRDALSTVEPRPGSFAGFRRQGFTLSSVAIKHIVSDSAHTSHHTAGATWGGAHVAQPQPQRTQGLQAEAEAGPGAGAGRTPAQARYGDSYSLFLAPRVSVIRPVRPIPVIRLHA